jgi:YVTN family beta-propeller protein
LLAAGGLDSAGSSTTDIVRVVPARARIVGRLPEGLHDAAAAHVGGADYVFGGGTVDGPSDAILRIGSGSAVTRVGHLPSGASDISAATIGRTVYLVGGDTRAGPLRTIVAFAPGRGAHVVGRLPRPLRYAAVATSGGAVIVAGGTSGLTARREVLRFEPSSGRVRRIGRLPAPTTHAAAAALDGRIYVLGGRGTAPTSQRDAIVSINPITGHPSRAGRLPRALSDLSAATEAGHVVVVGGRDAEGRARDEVWSLAPSSARSRRSATPSAIAGVYAHAGRHDLSPAVRGDPARVYVPDTEADRVDVISQRTRRVIRRIPVGHQPQHVTPSWDLRTLWVSNDLGNSLTPINPRTGHVGRPVAVTDPYNLYFTPDGHRAIVVAEARRELDFRTPHTMRLRHALKVPGCRGVDHMDDTADGRYALVSCEFAGRMIVVDLRRERVVRTIALRPGAMPQDVKLSPDGRTFYVADMASDGVWLVDARTWRLLRLQPTGRGAHGLYPSRDSRRLYVSNRDEGSISVISFATRRPIAKWRLPGSASPDMGGVSADGKVLWLTGRYDAEVYAISTRSGRLLRRIPVGAGPHGAAVWPQPGRYSIGHTGILR